MATTNCVLYARVSTKAQTEGMSLEIQNTVTAAEADRLGLTVMQTFNYTLSGFRKDNLGRFSRDLMAAGYTADSDFYVEISTMDRFCRNIANFEAFLETWPKVKIVSAERRQAMLTEEDRCMFRCDVIRAQAESEKISRRVIAALEHQRTTGTYKRPLRSEFGQSLKRKRDSDKIVTTEVDSEQNVIKLINLAGAEPTDESAEAIRALGFDVDFDDPAAPLSLTARNTPMQIAAFLNHHRILRRGQRWTVNYVRRLSTTPMLDDPAPHPEPTISPEEVDALLDKLAKAKISRQAIYHRVGDLRRKDAPAPSPDPSMFVTRRKGSKPRVRPVPSPSTPPPAPKPPVRSLPPRPLSPQRTDCPRLPRPPTLPVPSVFGPPPPRLGLPIPSFPVIPSLVALMPFAVPSAPTGYAPLPQSDSDCGM